MPRYLRIIEHVGIAVFGVLTVGLYVWVLFSTIVHNVK